MKGGGDWEEYCPACGLPFGSGYGQRHPYNWMTYAIGYAKDGAVYEVSDYSYGGTMVVDDKVTANKNENIPEEFQIDSWGEGDGMAVHEDCVKVIESKIGRKLIYNDALLLRTIYHADLDGFGGEQFFEWKKAKSELPSWIFESPFKNAKARQRILNKLPQEIKESSVTRAKAVHILSEHIPGLIPNIAHHITPYATGLASHQYMPERYKKPINHNSSIRRTRKTRKTRKNRKQARKTRRI